MAFNRFAKLALIGAAAITVPAWGIPVVWTLQNAALQPGGGSLSGNFTYDADSDTYSNWSITVTGATSYGVTPETFTPGNSSVLQAPPNSPNSPNSLMVADSDTGNVVVLFFTSYLTDLGGSITLSPFGSYVVNGFNPADNVFNSAGPAASVTAPVLIAQTITFSPINNALLGSAPMTLSATASSGLAVTFTSDSTSTCTVSGNIVTLIAGGECPITASQPGNSTYAAAAPVTQYFSVLAVQPVAAFLDQYGEPALTFNNSTTIAYTYGYLIGAPGVTQDLYGNVYVVGLDSAGGVHLKSRSYAIGIWNGWQYSGGILDTSSGLTAAMAPDGVVWFTGRDIGNRFWINSWDGMSFGGWILLDQGIFAHDSIPQIAIASSGIVYVVGKDIGGRVWSNSYDPSNQTFSGWVDRQAVIFGQPSATAGQDGNVYVAVRNAPLNSPVYITQIPADNAATANTWLSGGGLVNTDPQITSQGGTVYLMALAAGGAVYLLTFSEADQTYGAWTFTNQVLNDATIAAQGGDVFIAGRDTVDGTYGIYWYSQTANQWLYVGGAGLSSTPLLGAK